MAMATIRLPSPSPPLSHRLSLRPPSHSLTNILTKSRSQKIFVSCPSSLLRDSVPIIEQDSPPFSEDTVFSELDGASGIEPNLDLR